VYDEKIWRERNITLNSYDNRFRNLRMWDSGMDVSEESIESVKKHL
jgi:hypothetical protein